MRKSTRRILAIALAVVMVLTSMASAVFADDNSSTYTDSASILKGYGVFVGDGNGDLMLDQQLTRQDAVIIALRLMGNQDADFESYETLSDFTDITDEYYLPIIGMAQDLGLVEGMGDGTFGFDQLVTAQQLQTILLRALGYEITDDIYDQVPQMAQDLGLTNLVTVNGSEEITRDIVAQMMLNTLNTNVKDAEEKLGVQLGYMESTPEEPPVQAQALEVSGAQAMTDSSVKVTFNRAVADTSKLAFELKGTTTIETTTAWNEAKTEATLTAPSTLLEGAYTLKVTGDTFAEGKDTASLTIAKNGVGKIEFTSDKLIKSSNHAVDKKVTLKYKATDNYGVDITKTTLASDLEVAASKTVASFTVDTDTNVGTMELTLSAALADTDKTVAITIIGKKTGVAGTATLNIADAAKADVLTIKPVEFAKTTPATTKLLTGKATAAYLPVEVKDQYGNAILSKAQLDTDVLVVVSDANVVLTSEEYTPDGQTTKALRYTIDTTSLTTEKAVNVTIVTKLAGKSVSTSLDIKKPATPDKVSIGSPTTVVTASDIANSLVIPITVIDQYGVQLTPDEIVSNISNLTLSATGALNGKIQIATSGANRGNLVNNLALGAAVGTTVITLSTSTNVATATVDVKDAAYEKTIQVDGAPAANLLMGASTKMDYKFLDQYGRLIKAPAGTTKVTFEVSNVAILEATDGTVTTAVNATAVISDAAKMSTDNQVVLSTKGTEGTAKLTAKLYDAAGTSVISTVDTNIVVTAGAPSTLTYELADIPTLYSIAAGDGAVDGTDAYARAIKLIAKDAAGTTYAIPNNRIMSVTTADADLITLSGNIVSSAIKAENGYYLVAAKDRDDSAFKEAGAPLTKEATIKVVVSTDSGPKEVTKKVTVSREDAKATKVVFAYDPENVGTAPVSLSTNPYALTKTAKEIVDMTGTAAAIMAQKFFAYEVDQYGLYSALTPTFKIVSIDKFTNGISYASNQLVFNKEQAELNETIYVMVQASSNTSVYSTFSIKVTDGTATIDETIPTFTAAATQTNASNAFEVAADADGNPVITLASTLSGAYGNSIQVEVVANNGANIANKIEASYAAGVLTINIDEAAGAGTLALTALETAVEAAGDFVVTYGIGKGAVLIDEDDAFVAEAFAGGSDSVVLTFAEALDATTINTADVNTDFAFANGGAVVVTGTGALSVGNTVYTMTIAAADKNIEASTVNAKATQVKDLAGNAAATTAVNVD